MKNGLFILILAFCFCSCIKEDVPPCPDQYKVQLFVKDKNYGNQQTIDENLPFRQYAGTIYYVLHNIETGNDIYSPFITVTGDEKEYPVQFSNIPNGRYLLSVWGNLPNTGVVDGTKINLHPEQQESTDMYLASDTLVFTSDRQSASLGLERAKGKLQIVCKNFPDTINKVDIQVTNVYQNLASNYTYSGTTTVQKHFSLTGVSDPVLEAVLAPTISESTSKLTLSIFSNQGNSPIFTPATFDLIIKRNEVTSVEINYNDLSNQWEIWVQIDSQWTMIYQLDIERM